MTSFVSGVAFTESITTAFTASLRGTIPASTTYFVVTSGLGTIGSIATTEPFSANLIVSVVVTKSACHVVGSGSCVSC